MEQETRKIGQKNFGILLVSGEIGHEIVQNREFVKQTKIFDENFGLESFYR